MKTFSIQTLGCKVNHYEGEQLAGLLRARGLVPAASGEAADLRVVHTCSVTVQAASKSRQTVRRAVRLPLLQEHAVRIPGADLLESRVVHDPSDRAGNGPALPASGDAIHLEAGPSALHPDARSRAPRRARVIVTGCWATSDAQAAASLPGVDAVLTHRHDVAAELDRLLTHWVKEDSQTACEPSREPAADDGWMIKAGTPAGELTTLNKSKGVHLVKGNPDRTPSAHGPGMTRLPVLGQHQSGRQRATLKVQDGCDAHCTYCIIPSLRSSLWSKPLDDAVEEARALIGAGHVEIVLTGIFLGAYGHSTALRRRQPAAAAGSRPPIGELVAALCTRVPGLRRVRLSSLEPGDLTAELISVLRDHPQVVPHFHLPLQSGSDRLLRRMNRQYTRDEFLRMLDRVHDAFDRPALTSDVIVGFPGESDEEFERTAEVVSRARFIHVHAFSFSPRPGTAAARWRGDFVHGPVVNERIERLNQLAFENSFTFRQQFVGEGVELLIESGPDRHGRCERYFAVKVAADAGVRAGDVVRARVTRVTPGATYAEVLR